MNTEELNQNEFLEVSNDSQEEKNEVKEKEVNEEELSETSDKYSPPFSRMRGLANIGEKRMMPDGTWTV